MEIMDLPDWVFDHKDGLGLCGCGDPEGTVLWLRDLFRTMVVNKELTDEQWRARWDKRKALTDGYAGLFVLYTLDHRGWTEHGGSVNGSWLTPLGQEMLDKLEALCDSFTPHTPPADTPADTAADSST